METGIRPYVTVWLALLVLTAVEVWLAYLQFSPAPMLLFLIVLSTGKAALIVAWFMHMKFERRSLALLLFPSLVFCIGLLFLLLPDAVS
jgi:cytochrome c oxidase subunit 4